MKRILLAFIAALALLPAFAQLSIDGTKTAAAPAHVGAFPWASRPACGSALSGYTARISDVGPAPGMRVMCDGTRWLPDGPQLLARSGVALSVTGSTTETTLASVTVPAGLLGVNGGLIVYSSWSYTNSANTKTLRAKFGGSSFLAFAQTTSATVHDFRRARNRNIASSQVWGIGNGQTAFPGAASSATLTTAADSTQAQNVDFTGQLGLSTETITLENYEVWVTP